MIIKQKPITDFSSDFVELAKSIADCNYNVNFDARTFFFQSEHCLFTVNDLRKIFSDKVNTSCNQEYCSIGTQDHQKKPCIRGTMKTNTYSSAKNEIDDALSFDLELSDSFLANKPTEAAIQIIIDRKQKFWTIIHHYYAVQSATQVLAHEASSDSFFGCGIMWQFCFIFINDKTNQGLVLDGFSYD